MENKIGIDFIIRQYQSGIPNYVEFARDIGLWESEKQVFSKYFNTNDWILDIGCGAGRTTFGLFQLGFQNIIGIDLTPEMISGANLLNEHFKTKIPFKVGNACELAFETGRFDAAIFSFNGMMSIPNPDHRKMALLEISRVLKDEGLYIFTTHDREHDEQYFEFWKDELIKWESGEQRQDLYQFGDIISSSKNESREIFIHIPNQAEIESFLINNGFEVLETFYRSDKFQETDAVRARSGECRFWVTKKA